MELADKVMLAAAPGLRSPRSVREGDCGPRIVDARVAGASLLEVVTKETQALIDELSGGNVAVVCPDAMVGDLSDALSASGISHGRASTTALETGVTVVPVSLVKGLELDGVVVVEPQDIVEIETLGLRALYVALTRPTQRLTVVHARDLPPSML